MPRKILLIESDAAFARALWQSLEGAGFEIRITSEPKEALEAAQAFAPDAIVLCAELPGTSGYLVCQKLKKDEATKEIPLVLTSAEATEDTFAKHRQLRVRAQDYLRKPFAPEELVERLAALLGAEEDEEVVSLEAEMGLEGAPPPADALPALDLGAIPDEPVAGSSALDEDLKLLDDAFDGLAAPAQGGEAPARTASDGDDVDVADRAQDGEASRERDLAALEDEADRALGELSVDDDGPAEAPAPPPPPVPSPRERGSRPTIRGASADLLRAAGIPVVSDGAPAREDTGSRALRARADDVAAREDTGSRALRARADDAAAREDTGSRALRARADEAAAREDTGSRALRARADEAAARRAEQAETDARKARAELEAALANAARNEADARAADERARAAEAERDEARREADAAAQDARAIEARVSELEAELAAARADADAARAEADAARAEVEGAAELRRRVQELESGAARGEERVLKAYQKIKADERVREKTRKALVIALQLLDEGAPAPEPAPEKKAAPALRRE